MKYSKGTKFTLDVHRIARLFLRDATGLKQFEFQNDLEAVDFLSQDGGLLQLWFMLDPLTEWDFDFYLFLDKKQTLSEKSQTLFSENWIGEIYISIGEFIYRQDDKEFNYRSIAASLIKNLYADICISQNAIYGFSADEYTQEEMRLIYQSSFQIFSSARFRQTSFG